MKVGKKHAVVPCLDCAEEIDLGPKVEVGQKVVCPYCEAYMEVINLDPLELSWDVGDFETDDDWEEDEVWEEDPAWDDAESQFSGEDWDGDDEWLDDN